MSGSAVVVLLLSLLCVSRGAATGRTYGAAVQPSDQLQASVTSTVASKQHRQVCAWAMHAGLHAGTHSKSEGRSRRCMCTMRAAFYLFET